jgi:hypothetical protein
VCVCGGGGGAGAGDNMDTPGFAHTRVTASVLFCGCVAVEAMTDYTHIQY